MKFSVDELLQQGIKAHKAGNIQKAKQLYLSILAEEPNHPDANHNLGVLGIGANNPESSLLHLKIALEANPKQTQYWLSMIESLIKLGQISNAKEVLLQGLEFGLRDEKIYHLAKQLDLQDAQPVSSRSEEAATDKNLAGLITLYNQGQLEEVISQATALVVDFPKTPALFNILGAAHAGLGQSYLAIDSYNRALEIDPNYILAHNNLGNALQETGAFTAAIKSYQRAIKLKPDYAEGYSNLGAAFQQKGDLTSAAENYQLAINLNPGSAEAHHNFGNALQEAGAFTAAIDSYERALKLKPDFMEVIGKKIYQQCQICDWAAIKKDRSLIPRLGVSTGVLSPLSMLPLEDHPERHLKRAKLYARTRFSVIPLPKSAPTLQKSTRLRIGYLSEGFREHPVMRLMVNMFRFHDRENFEIHAFSYGHGQADKLHEHLVKGFDAFHNAPEIPDQEFAELIQSKGIDILIDLTGFTQHCRPKILAYRAAPIQISYLGYPGSMGMEAIDYIIADNILVPEESRKFYSEKVIYMPHCYQISDNQRVIPVTHSTRIDEGLPDNEFVFCCFSKNYKITPREFDIWIRLLSKVEGSVLWLMQSNRWSEANLKKEAKARGLNPARLIFAEPCEYSRYLERMTKADLFLDTFNYNAGAIANDALWCSLPVLTLQGQSYVARMASSLLSAIDLPELITTNEQDYEQVALDLANNPKKLKLIKAKLSFNKDRSPLFDAERFTRNIESAYMQIYAKYFAGEKSEHLLIEEHGTH